jgi:hypothetical protein
MKEPTRSDALQAAQRVRDLARDVASDLAEGYRKSTRYFRMRAGVVAGWAVLSIATLFASCPPSGPTNALGAVVQVLPGDESLMGTQLLVKNDSSQNWTDVSFTLDGGWRVERKTVRAGDKVVLSLRQFQRDGASAPDDLRPQSIRIESRQGDATEPLVRR